VEMECRGRCAVVADGDSHRREGSASQDRPRRRPVARRPRRILAHTVQKSVGTLNASSPAMLRLLVAAAPLEPSATACDTSTLSTAGGGLPIDFLWTVVAAILVFFMQAGFGLLEAGFVRAKNVVNILMKNVMDLAFGSLVFF